MSGDTSIEWTDATWNPTTGCDKVSPGCDHCYAMTLAPRLKAMGSVHYQQDGDPRTSGPGFGIAMHADSLDWPLRKRKPLRIFVNSMSDLFHDGVSDDYIVDVFGVMAANYQWDRPTHTFQVLTKRHGRMRSLLNSDDFQWAVAKSAAMRTDEGHADLVHDAIAYHHWPLPNVQLGVSVENQQWADIRIPALLATPAAVRFLSCEPLLGPVDLRAVPRPACVCGERPVKVTEDRSVDVHRRGCPALRYPWPDWVIVGGESGRGARPMHPAWVRSLRDQCTEAGVPFLFKQWGAWAGFPAGASAYLGATDKTPVVLADAFGEIVPARTIGTREDYLWRVGKKAAGRELDGRTWDEFPEAVSA